MRDASTAISIFLRPALMLGGLAAALVALDFMMLQGHNGRTIAFADYGRVWSHRLEEHRYWQDRAASIEEKFGEFSADTPFAAADASGALRPYDEADGIIVTGSRFAPGVLSQGTTAEMMEDFAEAANDPYRAARVFDSDTGPVLIYTEVHKDWRPETVAEWRAAYQDAARTMHGIPRTWSNDSDFLAQVGPFGFTGGTWWEQPVNGAMFKTDFQYWKADLLRQYDVLIVTRAGPEAARQALAHLDLRPFITHAEFDQDVASRLLAAATPAGAAPQ